MSIRPTSEYDSLIYNQNNQSIWRLDGPLSGDFTAGASVAISVIINDMHINYKYSLSNDNIQLINRNKTLQAFLGVPGDILKILENYIITSDIPIDRLAQYHHLVSNYGWWIINPANQNIVYTLYGFKSPEFIEGFISVCNVFQSDFRDYIIGTPFKYNSATRTIINFDIQGYDVNLFTIDPKRPAPTGPYYTGSYEGDANALDFD